MNLIAFLGVCVCWMVGIATYANEIDYRNCESIQDIIAIETQEIADTNPADHDELAQLYVSRGESYLLDAQYEKAVEDFQNANSHLGYSLDVDASMMVAFRVAFGEAISYDNLGMQECAQEAIQQLQAIVTHIGCNDCIQQRPCYGITTPAANSIHFRDMVIACKHKKGKQDNPQEQNQDRYDDILGPNESPEPNWCEEVVTGVGRAIGCYCLLSSELCS